MGDEEEARGGGRSTDTGARWERKAGARQSRARERGEMRVGVGVWGFHWAGYSVSRDELIPVEQRSSI